MAFSSCSTPAYQQPVRQSCPDEIEGQIDTAIMQAAVILFVVDIREGVTGLDQHVSERLRAANKPVILILVGAATP